jgi:hypothetical protein
MKGSGEAQLKEAMRTILDPERARRFLLQPSQRDLQIVVPFDAHPRAPFTGAGNDPAMLAGLRAQVDALASNGGTDMYAALARALELLTEQPELSDAFPAIVLMTDGRSQGDAKALRARLANGARIPVYSITFGDADDSQLKQVADWTGGPRLRRTQRSGGRLPQGAGVQLMTRLLSLGLAAALFSLAGCGRGGSPAGTPAPAGPSAGPPARALTAVALYAGGEKMELIANPALPGPAGRAARAAARRGQGRQR